MEGDKRGGSLLMEGYKVHGESIGFYCWYVGRQREVAFHTHHFCVWAHHYHTTNLTTSKLMATALLSHYFSYNDAST